MQRFLWMLSICLLPLFVKAQTAPPAAEVLKTAEARAAKEHKNVLVMFHASWCHWCHEMDTAIADAACKPFFERSFVLEHLTVSESPAKKNLENPGAEALLKQYTDGKESGIPFWVVLDPKGKVLADSRQPGTGDNIGCPTTESDVAQLKDILAKTGKGSAAEINAIGERFLRIGK
ncbi:MAG TPA: thioredoxin family protein [Chitinophaga sp.]